MYLRTASVTVCLLDGFVLRTLHPDILQYDNHAPPLLRALPCHVTSKQHLHHLTRDAEIGRL